MIDWLIEHVGRFFGIWGVIVVALLIVAALSAVVALPFWLLWWLSQ